MLSILRGVSGLLKTPKVECFATIVNGFPIGGVLVFKWVKINLLLHLELPIGFENAKFSVSDCNNAKEKATNSLFLDKILVDFK